jgi:SHS2 domain-containing protein
MPSHLGALALTFNYGFRLLAHTADMGIEARAESCERVVEEMARGLTKLMFGRSPATELIKKSFAVHAEDPVELLVNCLNEFVYWSEKSNLVPAALHIERIGNGELRGTMTGEVFDPQRHDVEREVKSVTYHQACLEKTSAGWYARVYVDL